MTAPNLLHESLLSLGQAARRIPPYRGCKTNPSTIFRWLRDGVRLPNGELLRLEGMRLAGRWLTSEQALDRFLAAQDLECNPNLQLIPAAPMRTATQRRRASERAAREIDTNSAPLTDTSN